VCGGYGMGFLGSSELGARGVSGERRGDVVEGELDEEAGVLCGRGGAEEGGGEGEGEVE
jgi:hypothetical protein